jgi:hypothetical protein
MESFENLIRFVNSYPAWAKAVVLAGIIITITVLVFTPRTTTKAPGSITPKGGDILLKILGVTLFPQRPDTSVQVTAFVNETQFRYPSVAGVEWLEVGPNMVPQTFRLPQSQNYELRFELRLKGREPSESERMVSQEVLSLSGAPTSGQYNLYRRDENTHGVSVHAAVRYSVEVSQ